MKRMRIHTAALLSVLALVGTKPARAQDDHQHDHDHFGKVAFPNSCTPAVQDQLLRGIAMLHSFYYSGAQSAFQEVIALLGQCSGGHSIFSGRTLEVGVAEEF